MIEYELCAAELTPERTFDQVRSETLFFWRIDRRPAAQIGLGAPLPGDNDLLPFDRAPYLTALVASSWITNATITALVESNHRWGGPSSVMRLRCCYWNGSSARWTMALSEALSQISEVNRSCALSSACKRPMKASRSLVCLLKV